VEQTERTTVKAICARKNSTGTQNTKNLSDGFVGVVDMVEDAGFTPLEAVDADEAVAILESRSDIALLLTDIQMPGTMDGLGLARSVRERWPPIKIILVSGQLRLADIEIPADIRFFGKPLEAGEMIAEMQSMIGSA